jgi:hypothetical protein
MMAWDLTLLILKGTLVYTMQQSLATTTNLDLQSSLPHRNIGLSGRASYSYDNRDSL